MQELTKKEKSVLEVIQNGTQNGLPPTVREICASANIASTSSVHALLKSLEEKGYISRKSGLTRAISLPGSNASRIPLVGRVTAGRPIFAAENIEEYVSYNGKYRQNELFALRVMGDSMINAGILDGDVVVVRKEDNAANGTIVVALIEDEATVKRFYREKDHVRLQPENDKYEPILSQEVSVLGKVVCLIRDIA